MPFVPNLRRRWFGLFYLISSAGLLIWGLTVLRPVLRGWLFVAYWLACLGCALLAIGIAWLDMRAIRRHARAERRELLDQALVNISNETRRSLHEPPPGGARLPPSHPNQDPTTARPQPRSTGFMATAQVRKEQAASPPPEDHA